MGIPISRLSYLITYGEDKIMNTRIELESCYICGKPVFPEDKTGKKMINDVLKVRHLWHRIPNTGDYYFTLEDAKNAVNEYLTSRKVDYPNNGYISIDAHRILEEIERLEKREV